MKRLDALIVLAALLYAPIAAAAPAYHTGTGTDCGFSVSDAGTGRFHCAFSAAVSAGDLLIECTRIESGQSIISVSDTVNGAWTLVNSASFNSTNKHVYCYYFQNSAAGTPNVTITESASGGATGATQVLAYTGVKTTSALVAAGHTDNLSSATTHTCGAVTATAANQLLIGFVSTDGGAAVSPNNSETERFETAFEQQSEDKLTAGSGSVAPQWSHASADTGGCVTALFDTATVASGVVRNRHGRVGGPEVIR